MKKRVLVLVVDIDNDIGVKAGLQGPIVGRKNILNAAMKLALADPEDTDGNALFYGLKVVDELRKEGESADIALLAGHQAMGYAADKEIVRQLEKVLSDYSPESCVFISDGASDEMVLPVVQSRVKVDAVRTVTIKQTREIEKTYVVMLEKLKDPSIARIVFGIPALAILSVLLFGDTGIKVFLGLLGVLMLLRAFDVEDRIFRRLSSFDFSTNRVGFIFYFAAIPLILVSFVIASFKVSALQQAGLTNAPKLAAWFLKELLVLLPVALLFIVVGRAWEALHDNKRYLLTTHFVTGAAIVLSWIIFNSLADWVIGTTVFADVFYSLLLAVVAMVLVIYMAREFKGDFIGGMGLEGKHVYTQMGDRIGVVKSVDRKGDNFVVETRSGQKFDLALERVMSVDDKVVVKY